MERNVGDLLCWDHSDSEYAPHAYSGIHFPIDTNDCAFAGGLKWRTNGKVLIMNEGIPKLHSGFYPQNGGKLSVIIERPS